MQTARPVLQILTPDPGESLSCTLPVFVTAGNQEMGQLYF